MESKSSHEEITQFSARNVRVHCPKCYKLYAVDVKEIKEHRPRFQCTTCTTKFWFAFPEALEAKEVVGFPVEWLPQDEGGAKSARVSEGGKERKTELPCPKCQHTYSFGDKECSNCGVIFAKLYDPEVFKNEIFESKLSLASSFEKNDTPVEFVGELNAEIAVASSSTPWGPVERTLTEQWKKLLSQYDNKSLHQAFVQKAKELTGSSGFDGLNFALSKYSNLLNQQPHEEKAKLMKRQILALLSVAQEEAQAIQAMQSKLRVSGQPFFKLNWSSSLLFFCGVLIAIGLFLPGWQNLVGVGAALLFMVIVLRRYLSQI